MGKNIIQEWQKNQMAIFGNAVDIHSKTVSNWHWIKAPANVVIKLINVFSYSCIWYQMSEVGSTLVLLLYSRTFFKYLYSLEKLYFTTLQSITITFVFTTFYKYIKSLVSKHYTLVFKLVQKSCFFVHSHYYQSN